MARKNTVAGQKKYYFICIMYLYVDILGQKILDKS